MLWQLVALCFYFFLVSFVQVGSQCVHHLICRLTHWWIPPVSRYASSAQRQTPFRWGRGGGCNIYVGRGNSSICPVVAIDNILAVRGPVQGPLFCYADGCPLKWQLFLRVQPVLPSLGCSGSYSGHNFCNGTATKATTQESMITLSRLSAGGQVMHTNCISALWLDHLPRSPVKWPNR